MTTLVCFGGNGYIGREVTRLWLQRHPDDTVYSVSRSGKGDGGDPRVVQVRADLGDKGALDVLLRELPGKVDVVCDCVGRPEKDPALFERANWVPARTMVSLSRERGARAMAFIGGTLGPRPFVRGKARIVEMLRATGIPCAVVEPTLVYGMGRDDSMARMVPLLRCLGALAPSLRPVRVEQVAEELVEGIEGALRG